MNNFSEICGNENLINNLKSSIANDRVNHAYIFEGAKGMGKLTIANAFAKALNCSRGKSEACDNCISCQSFNSGSNPDIIYVTHKKTVISVDDVREQILQNVAVNPYNCRYKIFIIPDADKMNVAAQNAFLKSLEEPPSYVKFLLLCENSNKFLSTILSRCIIFKLRPVSQQKAADYLVKNNGLDMEKAMLYSSYSQGNIGRAIVLSQSEEFRENRLKAIELIDELEDCDMIRLYKLADTFKDYEKNQCDEILEDMFLLYRDALVLKSTGNIKNVIQKDIAETIKKVSKTDTGALIRRCEAINTTRNNLNINNANRQMAVEALFFKIKEK